MGTADIQLSKRLSWLLRHGGTSAGLQIDRRGYAFVDDILSRDDFKRVTVTQIRHIVATNSKQRFALETDADGRVMIRANQGHTIDDVNELGEHDNASARGTSADLTPITNDNMPRVCVHGTYARNWSSICADGGLSRMRRNHVHMAAGVGGAQVLVRTHTTTSDCAGDIGYACRLRHVHLCRRGRGHTRRSPAVLLVIKWRHFVAG
jgi:2'-phosphotransferase